MCLIFVTSFQSFGKNEWPNLYAQPRIQILKVISCIYIHIYLLNWCPLTCRLGLYNFISSCVRNANEDTHVNWWQRWMAMISIVTQALWHSFGLCSSCMGSLTVSSPGGFVWIYWRSVNFRMTFWCLRFSKKTTQKFDEFLP